MQIFEYYFNPKARGDRFFEIFSLELEKDSSKGNVYIVGELANALPQNSGLLRELSKIVSREYSSIPTLKFQEDFFRALLKRVNEFLAAKLREGNVDWLGNFHVALLFIKNSGKKSFFAIAKSGTMQAFMARGTNVVDLGKSMKDSSSQGSQVFGSIVSGTLFPQDKLLFLTNDMHGALLKDQGLSDLSVLSKEQHFKEFFQKKNKILSGISGLVFALLAEEVVPQTPKPSLLRKHILSFRLPKFQLSFSQFLRFPVLKAKAPSFIPSQAMKQKIILVSVLVAVVLGGFLLFQGERKELAKQAQTIVLQIQVIQKEAQDALALSDQRSANILLQEAFKKASLHTGKEVPFRETFIALKEHVEQQLFSINHIEHVKTPAVLVDVERENTDLIPQNMILAQGSLYLFNPFSSKLFMFDLETEKGKTIATPKVIRDGISLAGSALFFGEPDTLLRVDSDSRIETITLRRLPPFGGMAGFEKNIYVLNAQQGAIVKYEDPLNASNTPSAWIHEESLKKPTEAKSMTIDGNVWILTHNNVLERYFGGFWQEDITPLVFPLLKNATAIKTFPGLPYLYILDPSESRMILLTKSGDLVKQYRVEVQNPLLDFTVSRNGNTLYLLSGSRVFVIEQE